MSPAAACIATPRAAAPSYPRALPPAAAFRCPAQLFTWSGSSASVAFTGATSVTVVLDARLQGLPADHLQQTLTKKGPLQTFPWSFFRFEIDGKAVATAETSAGKPLLTWKRTGLTPGETDGRPAVLRGLLLLPGGGRCSALAGGCHEPAHPLHTALCCAVQPMPCRRAHPDHHQAFGCALGPAVAGGAGGEATRHPCCGRTSLCRLTVASCIRAEARYGTAWLQSIKLGGGGGATFQAPPPSPGDISGRRMVFLVRPGLAARLHYLRDRLPALAAAAAASTASPRTDLTLALPLPCLLRAGRLDHRGVGQHGQSEVQRRSGIQHGHHARLGPAGGQSLWRRRAGAGL